MLTGLWVYCLYDAVYVNLAVADSAMMVQRVALRSSPSSRLDYAAWFKVPVSSQVLVMR